MSKLRPHIKKIFVFLCLAAVLFSLLVLPSSAADYTLSGVRLLVSNPDVDSLLNGGSGLALYFVTERTSPNGLYFDFVSNGTLFCGITANNPSITNPGNVLVYSSSSGWVNQNYRLIDFGTNSFSDSSPLFKWVIDNSQDVTESSDYERGVLVGIQQGIDSSEAREKWYQTGYDEGLEDGLNSSGSSSLGQNLIGDTLSAPFRALNGFTLFEAPNGTVITLGIVFGGMLGFILLFAFLKLFAGG